MYEIICMFIKWEGSPITGTQILQKLNSKAGGCSQGCDAKVRTEHIVQVLLLCAVILALTGNPQTEKISIELEACVGVGNGDRGMVNPQEDAVTRAMPLGIALPLRKPKDFNGMLVRVLEIESPDAACVLVPVREALRGRRGVFDLVLTEDRIGTVHVAYDDCNVLEPEVVAPRIHWNGPAAGSEELSELDRFLTKLHVHQSHARTKNPEEMFNVLPGYLAV